MENSTVRHKAIPIRPGEILSQTAVDHYLFEARRLRAERFGEFGRALGHVLKRSGERLARTLVRWQQRRIAYRELNALEDRMLQDIGLSRGQIPSVVEGMLDIDSYRRPESRLGSILEACDVGQVCDDGSMEAANHRHSRDAA